MRFCLDCGQVRAEDEHHDNRFDLCKICHIKKGMPDHARGPCTIEGCTSRRLTDKLGLCTRHTTQAKRGLNPTNKNMFQFAIVKRNNKLRKMYMGPLLLRQGGKCADPFNRCIYNKHNEPLSEDVVDVDHILPRDQGGTNDIGNMQALCACCHAIKTRVEHTTFR